MHFSEYPLQLSGDLTFADLMKTPPKSWQRSGDLYLWEFLRDRIGYQSVPEGASEIRDFMSGEFERTTQKSIDSCGDVALSHHVTKNSDNTIVVNPEFWRDTVFPLLIERSKEQCLEGNVNLSRIYVSVQDYIRIRRTDTYVTIEVEKIEWDGPHTPVSQWVLVKELPLDCKIEAELAKVLRSRHFGFCDYCLTYNNAGHMHDKRLCQSCASAYFGVRY